MTAILHRPPAAALALALTLALAASLRAQDLPELEEILVTPTRAPTDPRHAPRSTSEVRAEEIRARGARSAPDALREVPGVHLQHTNTGGGSPFLRGLTGNQILILVDGIRLNNSTTRFGPNQALNTIDAALIERIEVVRGPGSVLYGSDAIGGVVQIFTRDRPRLLAGNSIGSGFYGRYSTAEDSLGGSLDFGASFEDWDFYTVLSAKSFGDLRGGADRGRQDFTGYEQWDLAGAFTLHLSEKERVRYSYQMTRQDDVDRTDKLSVQRNPNFVPDAINRFERQQRQLFAMSYENDDLGRVVEDLRTTFSLHRHLEQRVRRKQSGPPPFTPRDEIRFEGDDVYVLGLSLLMHSRSEDARGWKHELSYGLDSYFDLVSSTRHDLQPSTGARTRAIGRFADDSRYRSLGVFAEDRVTPAPGWTVTPGVRWSLFAIDATIEQAGGGVPEDVLNRFEHLTWGLSSTLDLDESWTLVAGAASAFRAPNIDDSTISGGFAFGEEIPNGNLDPETALDFELGMRYRREHLRGEIFAFHTAIDHIIQRVETATGSGEFQRRNVGRATIAGLEGWAEVPLGARWTAFGSVSWTTGRLFSDEDPTLDDVPFRRIPPLQGRLGLRFEEPLEGRYRLEGTLRWAAAQNRLHPGDVRDNRIGPQGTPGYAVLDLHGSYRLDENLRAYASVENLADLDYRTHGSGYLAPGRNLILGLEVRF